MISITGSILRRFSFLELNTADNKQYTLENTFFTRLAIRFIGVPHLGFRSRARFILKEALELPRTTKVLDAGCGYGLYALTLAENGRTVDAIDLDPARIEAIKRMLAEAPDLAAHIHPIVGSLTKLPFPEALYDLVICSDVIEHISDDASALNEISRVTKPGGILLLSVPHWSTRNVHIFRSFGHERPGYTEESLRTLLEKRGFTIQKTMFYEYWLGTVLFNLFNRIHSKALLGLLFYPFYALYLLDARLRLGKPNGIVVTAQKSF